MHNEICLEPPKHDAFLKLENEEKNRFRAILLYDHSRVKLTVKGGNDYYHASLVDSYAGKDNQILAQAPFNDVTDIGTHFLSAFLYFLKI